MISLSCWGIKHMLQPKTTKSTMINPTLIIEYGKDEYLVMKIFLFPITIEKEITDSIW